jgi:hypothetical protein
MYYHIKLKAAMLSFLSQMNSVLIFAYTLLMISFIIIIIIITNFFLWSRSPQN